MITKNEYADDVEIFLNEKLNNLTNISQEYYLSINESYFNLKNYLTKSLIDLNTLLNKCEEITYKTFNNEYESISKSTTNVSQKYSTKNKKISDKNYNKKSEHYNRYATAKISEFNEYAELGFDLSFEEGSLKKPKVKARIVDKSYPKKVKFIVSSPFGNCGQTINELNVEFNDANYTLNLDYNYEKNNINVTTFTNFEKYRYTTEVYQIAEYNDTSNIDAMGIDLDYIDNGECINTNKKQLQNTYSTDVDPKIYNETTIIEC